MVGCRVGPPPLAHVAPILVTVAGRERVREVLRERAGRGVVVGGYGSGVGREARGAKVGVLAVVSGILIATRLSHAKLGAQPLGLASDPAITEPED